MLEIEVQRRILPAFEIDGFVQHDLPHEELLDLKRIFPLGRLKREREEGLDVVEIQFDKNKKPKFVINFGTVPKGGVLLPWGQHLSQDAADVSALRGAYRLYSSASRKKWFQFSIFKLSTDEVIIEGLIDSALRSKSEIDNWFKSKEIGRCMRPFGIV